MKKVLALVLALVMIFALAACGQAAAPAATGGDLVGVAMPTSSESSLKIFFKDGGASTPFLTEKASPCACPSP